MYEYILIEKKFWERTFLSKSRKMTFCEVGPFQIDEILIIFGSIVLPWSKYMEQHKFETVSLTYTIVSYNDLLLRKFWMHNFFFKSKF